MKPPHWLRHHWSEWKPADKKGQHGMFLAPQIVDERTCERCGRRQRRYL